jgi:putative ABC transport system permease protein
VPAFLRRIHELLSRRRVAGDQDDEFGFHLEMETQKNMRAGMPPDEARRAAVLAFGSRERFRNETHDARGFITLENFVRDARHAARRIRRSPGFSLGAIVTLGVGLGISAGIGAIVHGVLVRDLPYSNPRDLVRVSLHTPGMAGASSLHNPATYAHLTAEPRMLSGLSASWTDDQVSITLTDVSERIVAGFVTPGTFDLLGVRPLLGRGFAPGDTAWAGPIGVLISEELWERRLGRDPDIVGKTLALNLGEREIIGVLPRAFDFPHPDVQVWYPTRITFERPTLTERHLNVIARLQAGATVADAQLALSAALSGLSARFPTITPDEIQRAQPTIAVESLKAATIAPIRAQILLLGGMVLVVLVVATCNVLNLFLLRAERVSKEVAIAVSLGATRLAMSQRFGVEGMLLGLVSTVIALPLAFLALSTRLGFSVRDIPRLHELSFGWETLAGIVFSAIVIGAGIGLLAWARTGSFSREQLVRAATRSTASRSWRRTQQTLVATQVAMALALVITAGLLGRSFWNLRTAELGFIPEGRTTFELSLPYGPGTRSTYPEMAAFHARVIDALGAIPGVTGAGAVTRVPLASVGGPGLTYKLQAVGEPGAVAIAASGAMATAGYFQVLGIPMIRGRTFQAGDMRGFPGIVVSEALAQRLFNSREAVGRFVSRTDDRGRTLTFQVIGVAGDVPRERIEDGADLIAYFPLLRDGDGLPPDSLPIPTRPRSLQYVVRSAVPLSAQAIQQVVHTVDAGIPALGVKSVTSLVDAATARVRLTLVLLGASGSAALLLGIVGVYSVAAYAAAQREREFGVRLALGAAPQNVGRLVLRESAWIAASGISAGVAIAWAAGRLLTALLYRVSPGSALEFVAGVVVIGTVTILATIVPARRAARTDPAVVLRGE